MTGFAHLTVGNLVMVALALVLLVLAVRKEYEPLFIVPIAFGMLLANIPTALSEGGISGSTLSYIYFGVASGIYPALIFLGLGAVTDLSPLIAHPRLMLLGAAAQLGIFLTFLLALASGFGGPEAGAAGLLAGADGVAAVFFSSKLSPRLIAPIAIAIYLYAALLRVIQPPIMRALTSREERLIRMKPGRYATKLEKMLLPVAAFLLCCLIVPRAATLLGMFFFGNLLRESGVAERLARAASTTILDTGTVLLGLAVGASASATHFLTLDSLKIFLLGLFGFVVATACGILFAKAVNLFAREHINPLLGAAGLSIVPRAPRVVQWVAAKEDPANFLLVHASCPNLAGTIGMVVAASLLWSILG